MDLQWILKIIKMMKNNYLTKKLLRFWVTLTAILLISTANAQNVTYYSKAAATDFNNTASWGNVADGSGTAPASMSLGDNFIIKNGSAMTLSAPASVRSLTIGSSAAPGTAAGTLTVAAGNSLTVAITSQNNTTLTINTSGTLTVTGGTITLNGNFLMAGGNFNQSGGDINIDGNNGTAGTNGTAANSVAQATHLFSLTGGTPNCTAGNITIVDPPFNTYTVQTTRAINIALTAGNTYFTGTHTFILGDGSSTAQGNTDGYVIECYSSGRCPVQNVTVNAGNTTGRWGSTSFANSTAWGTYIKGTLTVNSGSEFRVNTNSTSANEWMVGSIVNNGTLRTGRTTGTPVLYIGGHPNVTGYTPSSASSITGSGTFANLLATPTAHFNALVFNNANGISFGTGALALGTYGGHCSGSLTLTAGEINTNGQTFINGISIANTGTLTVTSGGFSSGSTYGRWWTTAQTGSAITANAVPTSATSQYPFSVNGQSRSVWILKNATAATSGGVITVTHNSAAGLVNFTGGADGAYTPNRRTNASWTVAYPTVNATTYNGGTATYTIAISGAGLFNSTVNTVRVANASAYPGGTHFGGTTLPHSQRSGISATSLASTLYMAVLNTDAQTIIQSAQTGPWSVGSTWVGGVAPTSSDLAMIMNGHNVSLDNNSNTAALVTVSSGGTLTAASNILTVVGGAATGITNNGTIVVSGGTIDLGPTGGSNRTLSCASGSTLTVSSGDLNVNGNLSLASGSTFNQSGGTISVDGNAAGVAANSVLTGTGSIIDINTSTLNLTGGTLVCVDPHASTTTTLSFRYNNGTTYTAGSGHTVKFGNGTSTDAGGTASSSYQMNMVAGSGRFNPANMVIDAPAGTNRKVTTSVSTQGINGNLTITQGEFVVSINTFFVGGDITNNGILTTTGTLTLGAGAATGTTVVASTTTQTIGGTGSFYNNSTPASSTANFFILTINNSNATGVSFSNANSLLSGTNTGTVSSTLNLTAGRINTGSNTFVLGASVGSNGTLSYTAGGFLPGSTFGHWYSITSMPTTAGANGTFPFITTAGDVRNLVVLRNATSFTTGGIFNVSHTNTTGVSPVSVADGAYTIEIRSNSYWTVAATSSLDIGPAQLTYAIRGDNATTPTVLANFRMLKASSVVGTYVAGSGSLANPVANRSAILTADYTGNFYVGYNSADGAAGTIQSAQTGPWSVGSTWVGGVAPTNIDAAIINNGHNVTIDGTNAASTLTINTGGILTGSGSNTLTVGAFLANSGTVNTTSGTINIGTTITNNGTINVNGGTLNAVSAAATFTAGNPSALNISAGTFNYGPAGGYNRTFASSTGNTLTVTGTGTFNVNGNFAVSGGTFTQTGGDINVDANSGTAGTSYTTAGGNIFTMTSGTISASAGNITIVDPPHNSVGSGSTNGVRAVNINLGAGNSYFTGTHTFIFGDGVSTTPGNTTDGFVLETYANGVAPIQNLTVNGGNTAGRHATPSFNNATNFGVFIKGNVTINANSELRTSYATGLFQVAGNIVNNGTLTVSTSAATSALVLGNFTVGGYVAPAMQTISGSGTFRNATTSPTGSFNYLTLNNNNGFAITANNLSVVNTLTLTAGSINLGSNNFGLGTATPAAGTLVYTSGGFTSGTFTRYYGTAQVAIGNIAGRYPFISAANDRSVYYGTSGIITTGGSVSVTYNDATGTTTVPMFTDGGVSIDKVSNAYWNVNQSGLNLGAVTALLRFSGAGITTVTNFADVRATGQTASAPGTSIAGTGSNAAPLANKNAMAVADFSNVDFYFSVPGCLTPTAVTSTPQSATSTNINWTCATCASNVVIEYGPAGFTPGTGTVAGGGTIATITGTPVYTLSGLSSSSVTDIYLRQDCGSGSVSSNSTVVKFIPGDVCANAISVSTYPYTTTGTTVGAANDYGTQSCSSNYGGGSDIVYALTISTPGLYQIDLTNTSSTNYIGWFLKDAANCSNISSSLACAVSGSSATATGTYTFASAGTYYLVIDYYPAPNSSAYSLAITKICPAVTAVSSTPATATSTNVTWTCATCSGNTIVEWGPAGYTPGTGATAGVTGTLATSTATTSFTVTGLPSTSVSDIYVRQDCGSGSYSANATVVKFIPGDVCANAIPVNTFTYSTTGTTVGAGNNYSTQTCSSSYGTGNDIVYELNITATGSYQIDLTNTSGTGYIGWFLKDAANCSNVSSSLACQVSGSGNLATGTYNFTSAGTYYLIIDYFPSPSSSAYSLTISNCFAPTAPALAVTGSTTANLTWTCASCASDVIVEYGPAGFTPGTGTTAGGGTIATSTATTSYGITFPSATTIYDVYMRRNCGSGSVSPNTTAVKFIPGDACLNALDLATLTSPYSSTTVGANQDFTETCASSGSADLVFYIDVADGATLNITNSTNNYDAVLALAYGGSCPGTTSILCTDANETTPNSWTNSTGSTQRVYWVQDGFSTGNTGTFTLTWSVITCQPVTAQTITPTSATDATVNWTCGTCASNVIVEYGPVGYTPGTALTAGVSGTLVTTTATTSTNITFPSATTIYDVYIRRNCGSGDISTNTSVIKFIPGDACANALDLSTLTSPYSSTTVGANQNITLTCASSGSSDLVFYIDVPNNYTLNIGNTANNYDAVLGVYYGGTCPGGTSINCYDTGELNVNTWINTTGSTQRVWFVQDGFSTTNSGTFTLDWSLVAPPICGPITATAATPSAYTAVITATQGPIVGTGFDIEYGLSPYTFTGVPTVTNVPSPYTINSLTANTTYQYRIRGNCNPNYGTWSSTTSFTTSPPPPANDDCAGAISASCGNTYSGTTVNSTVDAVYTNCGAGGDNTTQRGVWYVYNNTIGQSVTASTCSATGYDTRVTVYSGTCGALTCMGGNDDMGAACSFSTTRSSVTFNALANTNYYIFVHGYQSGTSLSATGAFDLTVSCTSLCTPAPTNDVCASAEGLTNGLNSCTNTVTGFNTCASSPSTNPSSFSSFITYYDVWYSFVAGSTSQNLRFTLGSATNLGFAVYSACGGSPTQQQVTATSGTDYAVTGLTVGNTYYVQVLTPQANAGSFDVCTWYITCPVPTSLAATGTTFNSTNLGWTSNASGTTFDIDFAISPATPDGTPDIVGVSGTGASVTYPWTGLSASTTYIVSVRENCGGGDNSSWTSTITFTTPASCPVPSGLTATGTTFNSTTLGWTSNASGTTFDIDFAISPATPDGTADITGISGTGTSVTYPWSPLTPSTTYVVRVRENCGGGDNSVWTSSYTFTTPGTPAGNDVICNATTLTVNTQASFGTYNNNGATTDATPTISSPCQTLAARDVWFKAVVPTEGTMAVYFRTTSVTPALSDVAINVYSSSNNTCSGTLTQVGCDDDSGPSVLPFLYLTGLTPGNTLFIRVSDYTSSAPDNGNFDIAVTPYLEWTGATSTAWTTGTNWLSGDTYVPTTATNVLIPNVANDPVNSAGAGINSLVVLSGSTVTNSGGGLTIRGYLTANNAQFLGNNYTTMSGTTAQTISGNGSTFTKLRINHTGPGVTISTGANMQTVTGDLDLKAGTLIANGNLTIQSTATTQAYIDDFTSGNTGTITGNVKVERYITLGPNGFRYIGAPVATTAGGSTLNLSALSGFVISGIPGQTIPLATCTPTFNPTNVANNSPYGTFMYWQENGPYGSPACRQRGWWFQTTGTMTVARGYGAKLSGGNKVIYTGVPNTGTISNTGCTHTNVFATSLNGWNLVANPFPSSLSISSVSGDGSTANDMPGGFDGQIQFYQTSGPFTGTYVTYNVGTAAAPIALGQGFWVRVTNVGATPAFTLGAGHRTTNNATYYNTNSPVEHHLAINVSGNGFMDKTEVNFLPAAENGFDFYDGYKWDSRSEQPTLFTSVNSDNMSINSLPSLAETMVVPMGLKPGTSGNFSFTFEDVATFPSSAIIYLEDKKLGTMTNVRTISSYDFASSTNDNIDRFALHFQPGLQADVADQDCDNAGSIELTQPAPTVWSTYEVRGNDNNVYAQGNNLTGSVTVTNLPAQEYVVTVTHSSGYTAQEYITVNGSNPVNATINASATNVMIDEMVSLTANATNATEFVWNFGDGNTVTGTASVQHAYDAAGTYNVTLTASSNVCNDVATKTIIVGNTTGINTAESGLTINGVGTHVVVEFNNWGTGKANITMYDMLGQQVNSLTGVSTITGRQEIRLTDVKPGYYLVRVVSGDKTYSRKLFLTADE
jgi:hypothetical protein